jgi:hypothetical protein
MSDTTTAPAATGKPPRQPPQPYEVIEQPWDDVPGEEWVRRKNRSTGTQIPIKELADGSHVCGCVEHGFAITPVIKRSRVCDIARQPREWCPGCKDAPKPEPKKRESRGGVAPKDQTPEQRAEYQRQALEAQARIREAAMAEERAKARIDYEALGPKLAEAVAAYEAAIDAANAYEGDDASEVKRLFDLADVKMNTVLNYEGRKRVLERTLGIRVEEKEEVKL